jgi:carboxymethylenebutenolidase
MATYHHFAIVDTADGPMPMYLTTPEGKGPHPAVLVIQGMHGAESFELEVAERLAGAGYVAAVPDMFHRGPACFDFEELNRRRRQLSDAQKTADVNAALAYLQAQPFVQHDHIGILGFCMGGRTSYLMAATNPAFRAAADFYGGGVLVGDGGPAPFDLTANIRCPVIVFDGEEDKHPSPEEVRKIESELARHGIVHEVHIYPGVGHAFMSAQGARRKPEAIDDAWTRLLGWFERHLAPQPALSRG